MDEDRDQARHACLAALRIEAAIRKDNRARIHAGQSPIRVRIGIHSGPVVIGNIGGPARINYTIIGDSVNTASRLETLARTVDDLTKEVVTVISGDTAAMLGPEFKIQNIVASGSVGMDLNLNVLAMKLDNTEYEPEQFPGLVYKLPEMKATFLLFSNGKIVCTGTKSEDEVHAALDKLIENLKKVKQR